MTTATKKPLADWTLDQLTCFASRLVNHYYLAKDGGHDILADALDERLIQVNDELNRRKAVCSR